MRALAQAAGDELSRCSLVELLTAATALVAAVAAILGRRETRQVKAAAVGVTEAVTAQLDSIETKVDTATTTTEEPHGPTTP